jgi:hypothetical protein
MEMRSLAAAGSRDQHHFTAPTERTPSRGSASNGLPFVATTIAEAWRAAVPRRRRQPTSAPFHSADGADALQGIDQQWPSVPVEAWRAVPRSRCRPQIGTVSRHQQSGRPAGKRPAIGRSFVAMMIVQAWRAAVSPRSQHYCKL